MVNRNKVERQLGLCKEHIELLEEMHHLGFEQFVDSKKNIHSAERCLQLAIESLINIGNHVIASEGFRSPQDYADVFRVLTENGLLRKEDEQDLTAMVRFRNRLVHVYWEIEPETLWQIIGDNISELRRWAGQLGKYVAEH